MGQQARACYHGVPRVLAASSFAAELEQQAGAAEQQQAGARLSDTPALLKHMQGCRVNISIRATQ
jgi:hypothetical protein